MNIDTILASVVEAFEKILAELCGSPVNIHADPHQQPGGWVIGLLATLTAADEAFVTTHGADTALATVADAIAAQRGLAAITFQIE